MLTTDGSFDAIPTVFKYYLNYSKTLKQLASIIELLNIKVVCFSLSKFLNY
jgi:hypothetical protein